MKGEGSWGRVREREEERREIKGGSGELEEGRRKKEKDKGK